MTNTNPATHPVTVVDHLIALTDYAQQSQPDLSRQAAFVEALIAYRRYGMRIDDLPASVKGGR